MASGIKFNEKDSHFEAKYEKPWGGVASDAAPMDIAPNELIVGDGIVIKDGVFNAAAIDYTQGSASISYANIAQVFNVNNNLYFLDILGNIYDALLTANNNLFPTNIIVANASCVNASCVQVINGLVYIFCFQNGTEFVFDPVAVTFTLAQSFVGGRFCCTVDEYLITAYTNMPTDSPAIKSGRVNWSGPDEFTTFDPSVDRTAGNNVLVDVQDYIAAVFAMGNIAYVLRSQGLTQMTPTGVGISPFNFTSLWASEHGVGCTYPYTFAQYGYIAVWLNDTDIFVFSGSSAPQGITGAAKTSIYNDITGNDFPLAPPHSTPPISNPNGVFVCGCISNNNITITTPGGSSVNTKPASADLVYDLVICTTNCSTIAPYPVTLTIKVWTYNFKDKTWTRIVRVFFLYNAEFAVGNIYQAVCKSVYGLFQNQQQITFGYNIISRLVPLICVTVDTAYTVIASKYQATLKYGAKALNVPPAINLTFKQEEIRLTRQPQVRGVAIKATGVGTLTVTVSGQVNINNVSTPISVTFSPVVLNTTSLVTVTSSGIFTEEDPQLSITSSSFDGVIVKASMYGTYADGEPF